MKQVITFLILISLIRCDNDKVKNALLKDNKRVNSDSTTIPFEKSSEADYWRNDSIISKSTRQILTRLSEACGFTRTWILSNPQNQISNYLVKHQPNAVYHTTLIGMTQKGKPFSSLVEVRRFNQLLLGFLVTANNQVYANPGWIGYDASGAHAEKLDSFYEAYENKELNIVFKGESLLKLFPNDLEIRTYVAAAAKSKRDAETLLKMKHLTFHDDKRLSELFDISIREKDIMLQKATMEIMAYRDLLKKYLREL